VQLGSENAVPINQIRLTNEATNVLFYFVVLLDEDGVEIATYEHQDGTEPLTIEEDDLVAEIRIKITKTDDNETPRNVAFSILAEIECEERSSTSTTPSIFSTTTTKSKNESKFKFVEKLVIFI
jgi:hypothetical protein